VPYRWTILCVLFGARLTMAFQFQSAAALSPFLADAYGASLSEIGLLIGLYLAPGVVVALPGGAIAARLGDVRVVTTSLGLMLVGGLLATLTPGWEAAMAGRVLAGIGGVIVNIVMTKMLVDWFAGKEISTALAIFINSWPVGIALALLVLPPVAEGAGLAAARWATLGLIAAGLLAFVALYRPAPQASAPAAALAARPFPVAALTLAALIWAIYNAALAMVFSFGAAALAGQGWAIPTASATISAFMIAFSLAVPFGGVLADRSGRRDAVIVWSVASYAVLLPLVLAVPAAVAPALLVVTAILFSLAAGPIMALPATVLAPEARAFGMGVFFTIYYVVMMAAPALAGGVAERTGDAGIVFALGSGMAAICVLALALFRRTRSRSPQGAAP